MDYAGIHRWNQANTPYLLTVTPLGNMPRPVQTLRYSGTDQGERAYPLLFGGYYGNPGSHPDTRMAEAPTGCPVVGTTVSPSSRSRTGDKASRIRDDRRRTDRCARVHGDLLDSELIGALVLR